MIRKAVILAGGRGTRMLPYTKACPKETLPLSDKPALHYIVKEAVDSGITEILIVISPEKTQIVKYFTYDEALEQELIRQDKAYLTAELNDMLKRAKISFVSQEVADGTGGAVLLSQQFSDGEPVLIINGDDVMLTEKGAKPVSRQIMECYDKYGKSVLGVQEVSDEMISKCGSIQIVSQNGRNIEVGGIIEKPQKGQAFSNYALLGRYVITAESYRLLNETEQVKGEIRLTDALNTEAKTAGLYAYNFIGKRCDMGSKIGYVEAFIDFALADDDISDDVKKLLKNYRG